MQLAENPNAKKPTLSLFKKPVLQETAAQYPERSIEEQKLRWRRKISWEFAKAVDNSGMSKKSLKRFAMHKRQQVEEAFDAKWPRIRAVAMLLTMFAQRNMAKPQRKPRANDGKRDCKKQNEMRRANDGKQDCKMRDEKRSVQKTSKSARPGSMKPARPDFKVIRKAASADHRREIMAHSPRRQIAPR